MYFEGGNIQQFSWIWVAERSVVSRTSQNAAKLDLGGYELEAGKGNASNVERSSGSYEPKRSCMSKGVLSKQNTQPFKHAEDAQRGFITSSTATKNSVKIVEVVTKKCLDQAVCRGLSRKRLGASKECCESRLLDPGDCPLAATACLGWTNAERIPGQQHLCH